MAHSALKDILCYLIEKYGDNMNITRDSFYFEFSEKYGMHEKTVRSWFSNETIRLRTRSVAALADYFSSQILAIQPSWFNVKSLDAFKKVESNFRKKEINISLEIGKDVVTGEKLKESIEDLKGNYSLFRYAYENTGRIANELISFYEKGGQLMCRWYFRIIAHHIKTLRVSDGYVLPIEKNYYVLTVTHNPDQYAVPRVRTMLLGKLSANPDITKYRQGIVLSSVCSTNEPCAARVVLKRVDNITNIQNYAEEHVNFLTEAELKEKNPLEFRYLLKDIANHVTKNNDYVMTIATSHFAIKWGRGQGAK